jgi:hypothetical protein
MKTLTFVAILALTAVPAAFAAVPDEAQFASVIEDLPLMPGLKADDDRDVLFAEAQMGRIAETEAKGTVTIDAVYDFYRRTLPQLGWKVIDGRTYQREAEKLQIDATSSGTTTTVRFNVKPVASMR